MAQVGGHELAVDAMADEFAVEADAFDDMPVDGVGGLKGDPVPRAPMKRGLRRAQKVLGIHDVPPIV
jgi:hypothetical protein